MMHRRAFLKGLLTTTAVVAVPAVLRWDAVLDARPLHAGMDLAAPGSDMTILTQHYMDQIVSATRIPARMLFGGAESADDYYAYIKRTMDDWHAEYTIRSFPSEVQDGERSEGQSSQRARQEAWQRFAEFAERRRRWQAQQESGNVATVQINGGEVR